MRFEWLFLGYLLLFQLTFGEITILPVAGYTLMLFAMLRLSKFEPAFAKAKRVLYAAVPIGAALLALQIYSVSLDGAPAPGWYGYVYNTVRILSECAEVATMFFVYLGVRAIGKTAEIPALVRHSSRNMAVMFVYFVFEMLMSALSILVPQIFEGYELILLYPFIIGLIWRILNLWMIITCYLGVTREDETENKREKNAVKDQKKKKKRR